MGDLRLSVKFDATIERQDLSFCFQSYVSMLRLAILVESRTVDVGFYAPPKIRTLSLQHQEQIPLFCSCKGSSL